MERSERRGNHGKRWRWRTDLPEAERPCSGCGKPRGREGHRYCKACHAADMRRRRPKHSELRPEAKKKANCRAYTTTYKKRGLIVPTPCSRCGDPDVEAHHFDYSKPLAVIWLCKECHRREHSS